MTTHELVLVGGGHAHVQVLRRFGMRPQAGVRLTLVVDRPEAVYSGMVPGFVAGQYARHELEIDVRPLAMRARAAVVVAAAVGIDAETRRIELAGRPPLRFDTASLDVGSTVAGTALPGVREHAIPTRPIGDFVARVDAWLTSASAGARVVVVGAGAGGVELAFALRARLGAPVTLLEAGDRVLPGAPEVLAQRVERAAAARGIAIRTGARVASVGADRVCLEDGGEVPGELCVWVTGATPPAWLRDTGLPSDPQGFVCVGPTLQVEGHESLFAAGDCAHFAPGLPKAGVYAVRQGPVLEHNLRARIEGGVPRRYRPQRDFLALLNLGDGSAIGARSGRSFEGRGAMRLKDWIDRRFMRRFQVLGPEGARTREFPEMPGMSAEEMPCGGCAAKVGESVLHRALGRLGVVADDAVVLGLGAPDDAAAVETPGGELVVASVDAFRAFTDDPYLVGRVSAVNAASDLWAKGVAPRFALAQVAVPETDPERSEEILYQALAGARACFDAAGVTLVGGHTTTGDALAVGFAIWGTATDRDALLRIGGLAPGDRLILTKPVGTGVLLAADMRGLARGAWIEAANASMLRTNAAASAVAVAHGASACTDVSGFGLAGHLGEMLRASKASARLALERLPLLPGAAELLARGLRSSFHPENARARRALHVEASAATRPELDALFDPQTSGGLLFGVPEARAEAALAALRKGGDPAAACIGDVEPPRPDGALFAVTSR
ncbi:MAG: selenide, water dikinase SelD [Myxococcota bacterium]|nr:selenide, water dikinase SelD [Myxococcota bacterium]